MTTIASDAGPRIQARSYAGAAAWVWAGVAVGAFHVAYLVPALGLLMGVYLYGLVRLTEVRGARRAFYAGLGVGLACYAPQLWFFTRIFGPPAAALWILLASWVGLFVLIGSRVRKVEGLPPWLWVVALPILWTGLEYFRSELYYFRFAWLTPGIAMGGHPLGGSFLVAAIGSYGAGFVMMLLASVIASKALRLSTYIVLAVAALMVIAYLLPSWAQARFRTYRPAVVVGIQLELPSTREILESLDAAIAAHPDAALLVMSEYSLTTPPPQEVRDWCRRHERHLIIGGMKPLPSRNGRERFMDTAFVIDPRGEVVFSQGKSVPIQFFDDGVAAREQRVWASPWGPLGICICYDLSYTRVTDEFVRQGARTLIVPAMDAQSWGAQQHQLHARIAPVRAMEYGLPIIRVASSGISQFVSAGGGERARVEFPGRGQIITARLLGFNRAGRLPIDRHLAPMCVAMTAAIVTVLAGARLMKRFGREAA